MKGKHIENLGFIPKSLLIVPCYWFFMPLLSLLKERVRICPPPNLSMLVKTKEEVGTIKMKCILAYLSDKWHYPEISV